MNADNIRIVLVEPTHPGNIGAVARAMANMGLRHLYLVTPQRFPSAEATARAAGADWILDGARVFEDLDAAIADCEFSIGLTARARSIEWPRIDPREAAARASVESRTRQVAILFGRESRGLSNADLERCNCLATIPAAAEFSSLNLASAVLLMAYELRLMASGSESPTLESGDEHVRYADAGQLRGCYQHLETVLREIDFLKTESSTRLLRKIVRVFVRARLTEQEVNILRGILTCVQNRRRL